jgi:hypothetical protein
LVALVLSALVWTSPMEVWVEVLTASVLASVVALTTFGKDKVWLM